MAVESFIFFSYVSKLPYISPAINPELMVEDVKPLAPKTRLTLSNFISSIVPFLSSDKFANFIVGPVGSTKTTASLIKIGYEAKRIKASPDGIRRSRCAVIRNTRQMLWDTTIPDFLKWFPDGEAGLLEKTNSKFLLKFDDVECEILFRGLDDYRAPGKHAGHGNGEVPRSFGAA